MRIVRNTMDSVLSNILFFFFKLNCALQLCLCQKSKPGEQADVPKVKLGEQRVHLIIVVFNFVIDSKSSHEIGT